MSESITWPKESCMAALLTVNLDAEQFWLGMFDGAERRPKTLSMGEYGIHRGLDRVLKTYLDHRVKSTFFVPGRVIENHPDAIDKILKDGHELALHGHTHTPMHLLTRDQQKWEFERSIEAYVRHVGHAPLGFRAPEGEVTVDTMELAVEFGFRYSSSLYDDDRPYVGKNGLIEIPMNWNLHDFPYFAFNYGPAFPIGQGRVSSYLRVKENYTEEFDAYLHYGLCYVAQFTPQAIGSPGKIQILEAVVDYVCGLKTVWVGTCEQLLKQMQLIETT